MPSNNECNQCGNTTGTSCERGCPIYLGTECITLTQEEKDNLGITTSSATLGEAITNIQAQIDTAVNFSCALLDGCSISSFGDVSNTAPLDGQVLKYSSAQGDYVPSDDENDIYTDEMAVDAVGTALTNTSSIVFNYNDTINTISATLNPSGVTAGTQGNNFNVPVITVNSEGRVTNLTTQSIVFPPSYTDENAQDAVGNALVSTNTINANYSDGLNQISFEVKPGSINATHLNSTAITNIITTTVTNNSSTLGTVPMSSAIPYFGSMSNFDGTGLGIVGDVIGWKICNGQNGTPDLRDKFVVGSSTTKPINTIGGSATHKHNFQVSGYTGFITTDTYGSPGTYNYSVWDNGVWKNSITNTVQYDMTSGGGSEGNHRHDIFFNLDTYSASSIPPYYSMVYITRV